MADQEQTDRGRPEGAEPPLVEEHDEIDLGEGDEPTPEVDVQDTAAEDEAEDATPDGEGDEAAAEDGDTDPDTAQDLAGTESSRPPSDTGDLEDDAVEDGDVDAEAPLEADADESPDAEEVEPDAVAAASDEPEPTDSDDVEPTDEVEPEPAGDPDDLDPEDRAALLPPPHAVDPDGDDDTGEVPAVGAPLAQGPAGPDGPPTDGAEGTDETPRRRRRWPFLLGAAAVLGALYVAGWWLTGERMPANATVGGVEVSGLSPAAARTAVEKELGPRQGRPVTLTYGEKTFEVSPKDAGLALDVDRSVEQAGGVRSWDPRRIVALFVGDHEHAPALDVQDDKLRSVVETVADAVDVPVTEALITFPDAKPKARQPKPGLVVRRDDAADAITGAYLVTTKPVEVPTERAEPAVDAEGLQRAMQEIARPAVSAPVTIAVGDKRLKLPVTAYAPALTVEVPEDGTELEPVIDAKKLAKPLTDSTTGIGRKAVDATVDIRGGKPTVIPGKKGVGLQPQEMARKLVPVLTKTGDARRVSIEAKVVDPTFTTADARKLGIRQKVSEFTTRFPYAEYRNINQSRAAALIDGVIVKPGETFSFNDTVGERTQANGFVVGTIINGGVFREELGGGVSQVVTTTYNAAFFAGMDDVEHHPHAFWIDRYPVGREATVAWGSLDLKFRNSTKYGVLIKANVQKSAPGRQGVTTVQMWSTKVWDIKAGQSAKRNFRSPGTQYDDTNRCVPQSPIQGFDIDIYRTFLRDGRKVKSETVTARYQAADRVICGKKPADD
ncbi:MAG: VanW family protein [Aeromicrobium erythreum]